MRKIKVTLSFIGFLTYSIGFSQDTSFFTKEGYGTSDKSKAYSYEVSDSNDGVFVRYFIDVDTVALRGVRRGGSIHGKVVTYYESGKKKEVSRYSEGYKYGELSRWYPSGNKMGDFYLMHYEEVNENRFDHTEKIISLFDSLGIAVVSEGGGNAFELDFYGNVIGTGEVKSGLKSGSWSGKIEDAGKEISIAYKETYENGRLIEGVSGDMEGNSYKYDKIESSPEYKGGLKGFYSFLKRNMRYPKLAQRKGIEGRVFIQFNVEKDGSLTGFKVVKGVGGGCDEEALRVLSISKDWIPGRFRGQIARTKLIQNILFKFR